MTSMRHEDHGLADALEALRRAEARMQTQPHVEAAVLAAWDMAHPPGMASRPRTFWRSAAAVAAAVTIAAGLAQLGQRLQRATQSAPGQSENSRTLLLVGEPILQGEPVRMVRMRVPASTLTGLGVRPVTGTRGEHIDVDVIVGEDGVARAIRVGR
jgi:hypothetical protein